MQAFYHHQKNTRVIQKKVVMTWRPAFGQDRKQAVCRTASTQKVQQLLVPRGHLNAPTQKISTEPHHIGQHTSRRQEAFTNK